MLFALTESYFEKFNFKDRTAWIAWAKTVRAPCEHCRFCELKFSIRKYVIVVFANETAAKEVEEIDIPEISVDRRGCIVNFFIDNRDSVTGARESYGSLCCSFFF